MTASSQSPRTRGIFWDNDGVLVDTEELYFTSNQLALREVGVELQLSAYVAHFLQAGTGLREILLEHGKSPAMVTEVRAHRDEVFTRLVVDAECAIPSAAEVVRELHGRYRMGIVTSSERPHFEMIHRHTTLLPYFDFVLASGDYQRSKPYADPYLAAMQRSGLTRDECVVVEDSVRGLRSAIAAGIRCVVVPSSMTVGDDFEGAWQVLRSLDELPALLD